MKKTLPQKNKKKKTKTKKNKKKKKQQKKNNNKNKAKQKKKNNKKQTNKGVANKKKKLLINHFSSASLTQLSVGDPVGSQVKEAPSTGQQTYARAEKLSSGGVKNDVHTCRKTFGFALSALISKKKKYDDNGLINIFNVFLKTKLYIFLYNLLNTKS